MKWKDTQQQQKKPISKNSIHYSISREHYGTLLLILSFFFFTLFLKSCTLLLTDGIFETGAYGVPSKSQNSTVLCQGGPSSTTLPTAEIISGKNARAWVSMVLNLKK